MFSIKKVYPISYCNKPSAYTFKRFQGDLEPLKSQVSNNKFEKFTSKGPFSNIPKLEKHSKNNSCLVLKLPPLSTYYIKSLNFSGIIQEKKNELSPCKKSTPWYKSLFAFRTPKTKYSEDDSINLEFISDNTDFQKISTLNKPTNILINLFTDTTNTHTLAINFSNSYTIINPNENILSYSENVTRVNSGKNVETVGGMGILTLISQNNLQHIVMEKDQELIFEVDRLIGFLNNAKLKFEWTNINSDNKLLYGRGNKYLKCIGEGELILKN